MAVPSRVQRQEAIDMQHATSDKPSAGMSLPEPDTKDLKGKQSVRATFKLSEACISALQIVATHLGIKQKSLFDHLMEDTESLRSIGREIADRASDHGDKVQKTFVISRLALSSLDSISQDFNVSRNALIECSVRRLLPIISQERRKHSHHKKLMLKMEIHYNSGRDLLGRIRSAVGPDDPLYLRFESVIRGYANMVQEMHELIEKGNAIEGFKDDAFGRMGF